MSSNATADKLKQQGAIFAQKSSELAKQSANIAQQGLKKSSDIAQQGYSESMKETQIKKGWLYLAGLIIVVLIILVFVYANDGFTGEPMVDYGGTQRRYIQPDHLGSDGKSLIEDYNKDLKVQPNYSS